METRGKPVHIHLLSEDGKEVEHTSVFDKFKDQVELDEWLGTDGKGWLVKRIAFDHDHIDLYLSQIPVSSLN